jgi:hypothetical protein
VRGFRLLVLLVEGFRALAVELLGRLSLLVGCELRDELLERVLPVAGRLD